VKLQVQSSTWLNLPLTALFFCGRPVGCRQGQLNSAVVHERLRLNVLEKIALLVLLTSYVFGAGAAVPGESGLLGILELKTIAVSPAGEPKLDAPIDLRSEPKATSSTIDATGNLSDLAHYEWSYEQPGFAFYGHVYDGEKAWYELEIRRNRQRGWVQQREDLHVHWLSTLIDESLPYLTSAWDKKLFSDPTDQNSVSELGVSGEEIPIMVAGTEMVDGDLWFLVVVLRESQCASASAPSVLRSGWVPAHTNSGLLNIWFYSRGC
jgi:hypothetical protein